MYTSIPCDNYELYECEYLTHSRAVVDSSRLSFPRIMNEFDIRQYESLMDAINVIVNNGYAAEIKREAKKGYTVVQVERHLKANDRSNQCSTAEK